MLMDTWGTHDPSTMLYPQAEQIHYAVLNQRDYTVLLRAGVPAARLHHLPNSAASNGHVSDRNHARQQLQRRFGIPSTEPFLLYPVRGIRRKNLGEALLWSALSGSTAHVGVTLAPLNAAEQPYYQRWKQVADELQLPVRFEIGGTAGLPLDTNLAAADFMLTTSVTEGFGMAFLESWLAERTLIGRDLPEITTDFVASGLQLDLMYRQLRIPLDVIGRGAFHDLLQTSYTAVLALYRRPAPASEELVRMTAERTAEDTVDFADLDEHLQEQVLRAVQTDPRLREDLMCQNPCVRRALATPRPDSRAIIMQNKLVACQEYSLAASGARLWQAYQEVLVSPRSPRVSILRHGQRILDDFLAPHRFRILRG